MKVIAGVHPVHMTNEEHHPAAAGLKPAGAANVYTHVKR